MGLWRGLAENKWGISLMLLGAAIGVIGALLGKMPAIIAAAVLVLLGLAVLFVPSPKAPKDERDEEALPLIKGRISGVRFNGIVSSATGLGHRHRHISSAVLFDVYLCNHAEPETNLQEIVLDGKHLVPPVEFGQVGGEIKGKHLTFGCGITVYSLQVMATIIGYGHRSELPQIDLQNLEAYAVDGLGQKHPLTVDSGENLLFSP